MTLDKSTLVRSTRIRLCKPRRTIGARALAKSPSTNRADHFDRSSSHLRSREGVGPCSGEISLESTTGAPGSPTPSFLLSY